jgi:hypothetical protein
LLLFHICLILFGWPLVTFQDIQRVKTMFIYLFVAWAAVIVLLFLVSRSVDGPISPEESQTGKK